MRGSSIGRRLSLLITLAALIGARLSVAQAQQSALPANWQQLSPADFATLVQGYFQQGTFQSLSPADQASLATEGAQLFSQVDISNTSLSYQTLQTLQAVGQAQLDPLTGAQAKSALLARRDDWTGKPYAEMRAKVRLMTQLQLPDPMSMTEARRWVLAGGTSDQVPPNDLVYDFARQMFGNFQVIDRSFSVAWVGQINAPQTGDYTFFISPIDVNMGFSSPSVSVSMTVLVAGQAIITAAPPTPSAPLSLPTSPPVQVAPTSNWVSRSNAVTLTAGTPVTIQIAFSVNAPQKISMGAIHATLSWQGPGISTSLVPASAFSQAQTGAPGLQATYTWTARGQQQTLTRVDPMIDFSWTNSSLLLAQDPTSANQSADAMWQAMTAAAFISSYANPTPTSRIHPFLREPENASCGLSTARRQAFLDLLTQNPTLLDAMDPGLAVDFFQAFRVGTPDTALNVFGTWAGRQADLACALTADRFFDRNSRVSLAGMAMLTTQQLPAQITRLQQEFLQLPDGRCSLPVAYTLTYSYLGLGTLNTWIGTLDAKLADPTVIGDLRVNWLLARAHAQELARSVPLNYPFGALHPSSWPMDGRQYLFEAFKSAQTPSVQVRVAKEIAARLVSAGELQAAKDLLTKVSTSLPGDQQAVVATWQQQIDGFAAAATQAQQAQRSLANKGYLQTLQARRTQAASQGDTAAVSRYDSLISAASNQQ
jgi:hypothetical protein